MPRYLIKFVSQLSHAEDLQAGKLFMHSAAYYHDQECGRGDKKEGALSHHAMIYSAQHLPIYCLYTVGEEDVDCNGSIHINRCVIEDFDCINGYAVIIKFEEFTRQLSTLKTNGWSVYGGEVDYRIISPKDMKVIFESDKPLHLLVKEPRFQKQKEFRVIVAKPVEDDQKPVIYNFANSLESYSRIVGLSKLEVIDNEYIVPKREVNFNG